MTLQDLLRGLQVEYLEGGHHHARPGWVQLDCPWCGKGSRKFHLGFNVSAGYFNCWKCGGHHPVSVLLRLGSTYQQAQDFLAGRQIGRIDEKIRKGLVEPPHRGPLRKPHREYLRGRGFDPKHLVSLWDIEGIGISSRLSWRIYIPIYSGESRVSWTSRAIGDKVSQRYISASVNEEAVNHKHLIYGLSYCWHSIVIVEGPTDVWRIGPGAGGLFGTAFLPAQVNRLVKIPHRFICFDNSPEAQRQAEKLAEQLSAFPGETQNIQIDADDPGSAPEKEIKLIRKIAKIA